MTTIPKFSITDLLEAGVHFGHKRMRWNPKMAPYIYGVKNGIHIIDLQQTAPMLHEGLQMIYNVVKNNGKVLFVGTKKQASDIVAETAAKCGQYYVNHRWLGGMLTNWGTVSKSIKTLKDLENKSSEENAEAFDKLTKKEKLQNSREVEKLTKYLGGIRDMGGHPHILFVIDTNKESIAIQEANKLGIPVIAIVDTNCNPDGVTLPIPGNDDSAKSITLYCNLVASTVLAGIQDSLVESGVDLGAREDGVKLESMRADTREVKVKKPRAPLEVEVIKAEKVLAEEEKVETTEKPKLATEQKEGE